MGAVVTGGLLVALAPAAAQAAPTVTTAPAAVTTQRLVPPVVTRTATATVHFAPGKSYLTWYSQRILVRLLRSLPAGAVVQSTQVVGYVQARTAWDNGRTLATARAAEVRSHLLALRLPGRITTASGGIFGTTDRSRRAVVTITYRLPAAQTILFTQPEGMAVGDDDQPLTAYATSGLRVALRSTTASVCTVAGTVDAPVLHAVAPGDCSLVATQAGDATFAAAARVTRTVVISPLHVDPPAPTRYAVAFDGQGGAVTPESTEWVEGDDALVLPTPTRDGFSFLGWFTAAEGGTPAGHAGDGYTPAADVTLYAHWAAIAATYDVAYDAQSGTVSPTSVSWTEGDAALVLPTPTREGYSFDGWFTAAEGGTLVGAAGADYTPAADATLYAHWTVVSAAHVVTFHSNYADGPASTTQESEAAAALTANPFTGPAGGLTFAGWATEAGGAVVYADRAEYDFAASIDLYAVWGYQVTLYSYYWGGRGGDVYYCGRADGNCTTENTTHLVVNDLQYRYDFVVFPNQVAEGPLGGFEVSLLTSGWEIWVTGGVAFDPSLTLSTWWYGPSQYVEFDVTGSGTINDMPI